MPVFTFHDNQLFIEDVALQEIASKFGTPCYVYSKQALEHNWQQYATALQATGNPYKIFYAIKANSNIALLNILASLGSGFDAVSGGEIDRVIAAGGRADQIIFSGVGKSVAEITKAIELGIHSINIESTAELFRVHDIAKNLNKNINIAFRVNPDVEAHSHPYMSTGSKHNKFGIDHHEIIEVYQHAATLSHVTIKGLSCHIGSQITELDPILQAVDQLLNIINQLEALNIKLEFIDIGGGLGVRYDQESPPTPIEYINAVAKKLKGYNLELHIEPGRSIVADTGVLLTKVEYLKSTSDNNFAIVDAAMNDLIRPALYQSYHEIIAVNKADPGTKISTYSVVGPVCETGDFLGTDRQLAISPGSLLAIKNCGAYGFSMSSNYNTRPQCAEILVSGKDIFVIRERETIQQLLQNERLINAPRSVYS